MTDEPKLNATEEQANPPARPDGRQRWRQGRRRGPVKPQGKYCVVIPALNEAEAIGGLVRILKKMGLSVVVVDDASTDSTAARASEEGAIVISHLKTRGKGSSVRAGIDYALRNDFDGVITMDGDGQHDPRDLLRLMQDAERQHAAIALGNRMDKPGKMPASRRAVNRLMSSAISSLTRMPVPDSQCGLRLVRKEVLADIRLRSDRYGIESELLLASAHRRWKIIHVPVRSIYEGQKSSIRPVRDTVLFLGLIVRYLIKGGRL